MSMSVGASSNALSYLQSLLQQGTAGIGSAASDPLSELLETVSGSSGTSGQTSASATSGSSGSPSPFGSSTMAALISLQGQSANGVVAQSPSQLFAKIDTDGDGKITQTEFENALTGAGASKSDADALFAKLDGNSDGSVSLHEMTKAAQGHGHHRAHGGGGAKGGSGQSPLDELLSGAAADGASTQTTTNADGSTTTTISYSDGTSIDMTTPAAPSGSGTSSANASSGTDSAANSSTNNQSTANLLQQLIQLQSQMLSAAVPVLSALV